MKKKNKIFFWSINIYTPIESPNQIITKNVVDEII